MTYTSLFEPVNLLKYINYVNHHVFITWDWMAHEHEHDVKSFLYSSKIDTGGILYYHYQHALSVDVIFASALFCISILDPHLSIDLSDD